MFEVTAETVLAVYASHVCGTPQCTLLALSETTLNDETRTALLNSGEALGFGQDGVAFALISSDDGALGAEDVRTVVEGLDPVALVSCDEESARLLSAAYRAPLSMNEANRLLGRTVAAFDNLEELMKKPADKQRAWSLLKKLR